MQKILKPILGTFIQVAAYVISFFLAYGGQVRGTFRDVDSETGIVVADKFLTWFLIAYALAFLLSVIGYLVIYRYLSKPVASKKLAYRMGTAIISGVVVAGIYLTASLLAAMVLGKLDAAGLPLVVAVSTPLIGSALFVGIRFFSPLPN